MKKFICFLWVLPLVVFILLGFWQPGIKQATVDQTAFFAYVVIACLGIVQLLRLAVKKIEPAGNGSLFSSLRGWLIGNYVLSHLVVIIVLLCEYLMLLLFFGCSPSFGFVAFPIATLCAGIGLMILYVVIRFVITNSIYFTISLLGLVALFWGCSAFMITEHILPLLEVNVAPIYGKIFNYVMTGGCAFFLIPLFLWGFLLGSDEYSDDPYY